VAHGNGNGDDGAHIPERPTLEALRKAAAGCRACALWRCATQTVFGEGVTGDVRMMLVGEQPGDQEDRVGRPFVGPAGRLLDRALDEAGIGHEGVYLTNVVKHFKWRPSPTGKRRIHQRPNEREIAACKPWVEAEIELLHPRALVCLGAIAAKALLGKDVRVTRQRGQLIETPLAPLATATVHPSSILRAPDDTARRAAMEAFVADLAAVARALDGAERAGAGRLD
jgi:uracil-DNA glycosylase family protein